VWNKPELEAVIGYMTIDRVRKGSAEWGLYVIPEARATGCERQLLDRAWQYAGLRGLDSLLWWGSSAVPSLEAVVARLSPELVQRTYTYEGVIDTLNVSELNARSRVALESPVQLEISEGDYRTSDLRDIARLKLSIADTYGHEARLPDDIITRLAGAHESRRKRGLGHLTVLAREQSTSSVVGLAEVSWRESNPSVLGGWNLAVAPAYRGHGLGKALSATLMLAAKMRVPQARTIRMEMQETANALHERNEQLGFRLHHVDSLWMVRPESIERFCAVAP
jgi:GNAT superfamily N-acetyltransferase